MSDEIILLLDKIEESENHIGTWEFFNFSAMENEKQVARIAVDRLKEPEESDYYNDFSMDYSHDPPKPIPYLFAMHTEKEYRVHGLAGSLIEFANDYFKNRFDTAMHSGVINEGSAPRVWEKLAESGKAIEYDYRGDRRWAML